MVLRGGRRKEVYVKSIKREEVIKTVSDGRRQEEVQI
jgi:hypothetical protein